MTTVDDDDDDEDDERDVGQELHASGYARDNFVVSDEEAEEDAFEPRPPRRHPQPQRRQQTLDEVGPPITRDTRLEEAGLDEIHRDIVQAFVDRAQQMEENLRNKHGLRRPLFTDQQYREMAIRWTTTVAQMYTIRGVDKSKVDSYGSKFASLVQQFHDQYQEIMGGPAQSFSAVELGPRERRKREVVDLISDDEDGSDRGGRFDADDYEQEVEDEENLESSRYFADGGANRAPPLNQPGTAAVEQWHKRLEELNKSTKPKASHSGDGGSMTSGGYRRGGKKSFSRYKGGRGGPSRGGGGGSFSGAPTTGGITKRKGSVGRPPGRGKTPTATSAGSSRSKPAPSSKKSGSGGGGGGIPTMPY